MPRGIVFPDVGVVVFYTKDSPPVRMVKEWPVKAYPECGLAIRRDEMGLIIVQSMTGYFIGYVHTLRQAKQAVKFLSQADFNKHSMEKSILAWAGDLPVMTKEQAELVQTAYHTNLLHRS